jgi:transglutaminase-like putative cysteine protease
MRDCHSNALERLRTGSSVTARGMAGLLVTALLLTSWPVRALGESVAFERDPGAWLLARADELRLPTMLRTELSRRSGTRVPEPVTVRRQGTAPEFDARLRAVLALADGAGRERAAGAPGAVETASAAELRAAFRADRETLAAEWDRLDALWDRPATAPVLERLRTQRAAFQARFERLDRLLAGLDGPAATAGDEDLAWLRGQLRERERPRYTSDTLPVTRRVADGPIAPALTRDALDARLGLAAAGSGDALARGSLSGAAGEATGTRALEPPVPEDLAETPDVRFTPEIEALAASLGNDPVRIFNWVRNNVEFVPVQGSIQGADHCRATLACSDVDTASLLIALLRVSGIPARYQTGTVDVPDAAARNWVRGAETLQAAGNVFATGSIPGVIFNGDRLRVERTWVRALIDMSPSRGAVHVTGDTWVDLDAAFKQYDIIPQADLAPALDPNLFDTILATGTTDPVTQSLTGVDRTLIEGALDAETAAIAAGVATLDPTQPATDVTGADLIRQASPATLAGTVSGAVVSRGTPYAEVPSTQRHRLTFRLRNRFGSTLFAHATTLPEIAGERVELVYEPATAADEAALAALFTGATELSDTPTVIPSSIQVRGALRIGGSTVATGNAVPFGTQQSLVLEFAGPLGTRSIPGNVTAGAFVAVGIDPGRVSPELFDGLEADAARIQAADADPALYGSLDAYNTIGTVLQSGILGWFKDRDLRDRRLAKGADVISQRLPSSGFYFTNFAVSTLFGSPVDAALAGATLDIQNDYGFVLAKDHTDADLAVNVAYAQGQTGSEMEASTQEARLSLTGQPVQATSTMRILAQANDEGIPIYRIDAGNRATVVPLLEYGATDLGLVNDALNRGEEVVIPKRPVVFAGSPITGLITQDPATGSAAYLISGGFGVLNGGLAEFFDSMSWAVIVALFFAAVSVLGLFGLISAGVALFAGIMSVLLTIVSFFSDWSDVVEGQPSRGLTLGEAAAGLGIITLFSTNLVLGVYALLFPVTLGFILGALAIGIVSIFLTAVLSDVIISLLHKLLVPGPLLARRGGRSAGRPDDASGAQGRERAPYGALLGA